MKAMLLAAGRGTRMRPLTDHTPKVLLPVGGRPLIEHHVQRLAAAGFTQLVINHAYLGEQIEAFLGDGSRYGVRIDYSREGEPLETGGGIQRALPLLGPAPFAVLNTDIWTDYPLAQLRGQKPARAHLIMVPNPPQHPLGDFYLQPNGQLDMQTTGSKCTYAGIAVFHPDLFAGCVEGTFPLLPLFLRAIAGAQLTGEYYAGQWLDVGTPTRLQVADSLARGQTPA
jgi:MurNAc alpha-1-phosphate uridylyltransferase